MMGRCHNPRHRDTGWYGGRGIIVCDEWKADPAAFFRWCETQEPIPPGASIDRFPDLNGPYSPDNCRFATPAQQNRNMRTNIWVEHNGERMVLKDFVAKHGVVDYSTARQRIHNLGWDPVRAATAPPTPRGERRSRYA
jgi:hypothetical protein